MLIALELYSAADRHEPTRMIERHLTDQPRSLKIAILHYACAPIVGGVEQIISTHVRLFHKMGHRPYIVAGRGDPEVAGLPGVIIPEIDSRRPEILHVQKALLNSEPWAVAEFEVFTQRIQDILAETLRGTDICIVHNAFTMHKNLPLTVALARLAENGHGPRFVAWCHDLAWNNPLYSDELQSRWPWTPLKYALPNVTYVAISERRHEEMASLFRVPASTIRLVPNGIDPENFIPTSTQMAEIRDTLRWDERDWVFLAPLRITRRKNLELGIEIVAAMRAMGVNPLLVITGPPGPHNMRSNEYLDELLERRAEKGVEDNVSFLALLREDGPFDVSDELMTELYGWADALLVPSMQEGFGLPLLEAGIVRMPIFCSDIPIMREVGGKSANYFDPEGDPLAIAEDLLSVLRKPGPTLHRKYVMSTYSWDKIYQSRILPLFESVLAADDESRPNNSAVPGDQDTVRADGVF